MEIRYFQIIIPIIAIIFVARQVNEYRKSKSGFLETLLIAVFWAGVLALSLFPDFFSELIAKIFGIKNNVNAIIFFALGLLFYFQLQLYKMLKKQDEQLTEISRKIALDNPHSE